MVYDQRTYIGRHSSKEMLPSKQSPNFVHHASGSVRKTHNKRPAPASRTKPRAAPAERPKPCTWHASDLLRFKGMFDVGVTSSKAFEPGPGVRAAVVEILEPALPLAEIVLRVGLRQPQSSQTGDLLPIQSLHS